MHSEEGKRWTPVVEHVVLEPVHTETITVTDIKRFPVLRLITVDLKIQQ